MKIITIGNPEIIGADGEIQQVRGHQAWAVLARLLRSDRPVGRREIASEIFPDTDDPLGALRWCLASLRRATGPDTLKGDPIDLNFPEETYVDLWHLNDEKFSVPQPPEFLYGIEPAATSEFATWLMIERERISAQMHERLRREAMQAISVGNFDLAIKLAELAIRSRPLDESGHIILVKSLAMSGRVEIAVAHVDATEHEFLKEVGEKPSAALRAAARKNIADAPEGVSKNAVIDSLIKSGTAAVSAGAIDAGLDCLRRAAADAEKIGDNHLLARSLQELGTTLVHSIRGFDDEGAIVLRQAVEVASEIGSSQIAANSLRELGYVEALAGRRPSAAKYLEKALEYSIGDDDALAGVHAIAGFNLVDWGKSEKGISCFEQSLSLARKTGNRRREIWSLGIGAWGHIRAGNPAIAQGWLQSCHALCDEIRWIAFQPWPAALLAETKLLLNEGSNTLQKGLEESLALSGQLGDPCWEAANARAIGLMHDAANDEILAHKWMAHAHERCGVVTDLYAGLMVEILSDQVKLFVKTDQTENANRTARELLSLAARTHADNHLQFAVSIVNVKDMQNNPCRSLSTGH